MRVRAPALALLLACTAGAAAAQTAGVRGRIVDGVSHASVTGVQVRLTGLPDSSEVRATFTGDDGRFTLGGLGLHAYRLVATRLGYAPLRQTLSVTRADQDLGALALAPSALPLPAVRVNAPPPTAIQNADTTEFMARAFRTHPDATAEDLVGKLPGLTLENGSVKTNGETVQQVLVDGRPFFGSDPTLALRNLPADVIDRIQVYDKLSDQAEFTGFDDGQSTKTLNLILRRDRRQGRFGKAYAGGGGDRTDPRYLAGGSANLLHGDTRLSVIGLSNNVNQQNFSAQDLLGVLNSGGQRGGLFSGPGGRRNFGGRAPRGGGSGAPGGFGGIGGGLGADDFLVGAQDGVTATQSVGTNYAGQWGRTLTVDQSYFFNDADNRDDQAIARAYFVPQDSVSAYDQTSNGDNRNRNHRVDARLEWRPDSASSVLDRPRLYFQQNHAVASVAGQNLSGAGATLDQAQSASDGATTGDNLSNHAVLRHRFARRGRTLSLDFGLGTARKDGGDTQHSLTEFDQVQPAELDTLDQRTTLHSVTNTVSGRLVYTEPLGGRALAQAVYDPSLTRERSDARGAQLDPATGAYSLPDSGLSNVFTSSATAQGGGLGVRVAGAPWRLSANLLVQRTTLQVARTYPTAFGLTRAFAAVLPSLALNANLSGHRNLRVFWNTQVQPPAITQLQDVVDASNPLALSTGNPDLRPSVHRTFVARYSTTDPQRSRSTFVFVTVQQADDFIAGATHTATRDSVLADGVVLRQGTQLTAPVNLQGWWTASTFVTWSRPAPALKSVLNLNSSVTWTRTPGLLEQARNLADTWAFRQGVVLASNAGEDLDFTFAYTGTWNVTRNSLTRTLDGDYYTQLASLKLNVIAWHGLVLEHELSGTRSGGLASGYGPDALLWNTSVAEKFLRDRRGELRLTAADVLDQNRSTSRTATDTYLQDTRNTTLAPYVMLTFTYTLR